MTASGDLGRPWARVRTVALVVGAFLAGLFVAGGVGLAQTPCPSPSATPPVAAAPAVSAAEAIDWFREHGFDENETITAGLWGAMDFSVADGYVTSVMVMSDGDELTSIYVDEMGGGLTFVREVVARFVPEAGAWLETALATPPGESVRESFGDVGIDVSMSQVSGTPSAAVSIAYD